MDELVMRKNGPPLTAPTAPAVAPSAPVIVTARPRDVALVVVAPTGGKSGTRALVRSVRRHFLPGHRVRLILLGPRDEAPDEGVEFRFSDFCGWPEMKLERVGRTLEVVEEDLAGADHVFSLSAGAVLRDRVGEEVLGDLVAVTHPGYHEAPRARFPYEQREASTARVRPGEGRRYYSNVFHGGTRDAYLEALREIRRAIGRDRENGVEARWGDESHWNRWWIDHPPATVLDPSDAANSPRAEGGIRILARDPSLASASPILA